MALAKAITTSLLAGTILGCIAAWISPELPMTAIIFGIMTACTIFLFCDFPLRRALKVPESDKKTRVSQNVTLSYITSGAVLLTCGLVDVAPRLGGRIEAVFFLLFSMFGWACFLLGAGAVIECQEAQKKDSTNEDKNDTGSASS